MSAREGWLAAIGSSMIALGGFALGAGAQTVRFDAPRIVPVEGATTPVLAEVTGDGVDDLLVGSDSAPEVRLLAGDGEGGFGAAVAFPSGPGAAVAIDAADFDADGAVDVVAVAGGTGSFALLRGDGAGGFGAPEVTATSGSSLHTVRGAHLDDDDVLDLVLLDGAGSVLLYLGNGDGTFSFSNSISRPGLWPDVGVGDFDEDGNTDLVTTAGTSAALHLGDGSGGVLETFSFDDFRSLVGVDVADLNGDGHLDVLTKRLLITAEDLVIALGDGSGAFTRSYRRLALSSDGPIVSADVDGDGDIDVVVGSSVLANDGSGAFPTSKSVGGLGDQPRLLADVDADGRVDLVSVGPRTVVLPGDGAGDFDVAPRIEDDRPLATADLNGDGFPDVATTSAVHLADGVGGFYGAIPYPRGGDAAVAAGDLDGDGNLDLAIADTAADEIVVLLGDGAGGMTLAASFGARENVASIDIGDFDGDEIADLVVGSWFAGVETDHRTAVYRGDGAGGFTEIFETREVLNQQVLRVFATDVDGDLDLDVVTMFSGQLAFNELPTLRVVLGDGAGGFTVGSLTFLRREFIARDVEPADLDANGILDFVVPIGVSLFTLVGNGDGTFTKLEIPLDGRTVEKVAALDVDGDGHVDIATSGELSFFYGDGTGNLTPDPEDLRFALSMSRFSDLVAVDLEQDGRDDLLSASTASTRIIADRTFSVTDCRVGDVDRGQGAPVDVLLVNTTAGSGAERVVSVPPSGAIRIEMAAPPALSPAPFALYVTRGAPNQSTLDRQPRHLGLLCMPTPLTGRLPRPLLVANNTGRGIFGTPSLPSTAAPSVIVDGTAPSRLGTFFLQGIIADPGSPNGRAAVTNGIEVRIE